MLCRLVKLWITLILVVFTMGIFLHPARVSAADQVVTFPDANLQAAIRGATNKPTGDIYQSNLQALTWLTASARNISNIAGLEYCTNLLYLSLRVNQISDISSLASLTKLTTLYLGSNQISDISSLASLTNLTFLYLGTNQISDISSLASLTNLTSIHLSYNLISDISPLASLTKLTYLDLSNNQISNIYPLSSLANLTQLDLSGNQISNISPLSSLNNLKSPILYNNTPSMTSSFLNIPLLIGKGVNFVDYLPSGIFLICIIAGLVLILVLFQRRRIESNRLKEEIIAEIDEALESTKKT
jgi:Leucine-rich repeat (LRR) protein